MNYSHQPPSDPAAFSAFFFIYLVAIVFYLVSFWKIFTKAGKPGWASIIPIYNTVLLMDIIGHPRWWALFFFIPYVNVAMAVVLAIGLAKSFGKTTTFAIFGLFLFSFVGYPILAFGKSKYVKPTTSPKAPAQIN